MSDKASQREYLHLLLKVENQLIPTLHACFIFLSKSSEVYSILLNHPFITTGTALRAVVAQITEEGVDGGSMHVV